jgi:GNAT superfamily N-acetyltransferase
VLRRATIADIDAVARFNGRIHEPERPHLARMLETWTRSLMDGTHPTCRVSDFTVVEDTAKGRIASSLCLIPQVWSYDGVRFGVGRVELVGTLPEYRKRGLVREQFALVHRWSARRRHMIQVITGIPWFYRQFGYEMALELSCRTGARLSQVPQLKEGEREPFRLRPAKESDLALIGRVYNSAAARSPVHCVRGRAIWAHELKGRKPGSVDRALFRVIETRAGEPVGFLATEDHVEWRGLRALFYELKPGVSWLAVTPSVLRHLAKTGAEMAKRDKTEVDSVVLELGSGHPAHQVLPQHFREMSRYAYYIRMPDLAGFLRRIRPVLENRLASSVAAGHTGDLKLTSYVTGLHLEFEHGKLVKCEESTPEEWVTAFPDLTFLQVLFGHRSPEELEHAYADCRVRSGADRVLLNALFPKRPSEVWPLA